MSRNAAVSADWWERPSVRPTQPSVERDLPTPTQVVPTSPAQPGPTTSPTGGLPGSTPTQTPSSSKGDTTEDPCAAGKSYTGSYCGWSPGVGGGGQGSTEPTRIGGPEVKGLSYTSSSDLALSDIILLTGVLCLLLYARSKMSIRRNI